MATLFLAPLSLGVISAVLGALISITDRIVNNYGDVVIDINSGKKDLNVKGGSPLLLSLAEQDIFVPSACGGRGSCGACKVKVLSDVGPHLPTETPYLTKEEQAENIRLSCQVKVKQSLEIEIPEELFNIQKLTTKVKKITDVTHDIKEVLLELPEGTDLQYQPGQYGQFEVPPYNKIKERTQRAYSFSSNPNDKNHLEFLIRLVPGGIVTTYVHEHLQEGQSINVVAPVGDFKVQKTDAQMICVAGGSGMAPFKSIFSHMVDTGEIENREVWYFFGARTTKDLFYLEWLADLEKKYKNFHFIPALSEPEENADWKGETGLITEVLKSYLETKIDTEKTKEGYLCGSPGMLDACMIVMRQFGMDENKIYFDKFA
ncbi:oxidoreductase [Spirochaeta lutea]|uniref:Oxidoreductase n=1 Tax=Spirochaeta lutea TaxID=1480694 RepID=A0A098R366_9SPIO|nr:oxidoreductase [Spirochaeta lutea]